MLVLDQFSSELRSNLVICRSNNPFDVLIYEFTVVKMTIR